VNSVGKMNSLIMEFYTWIQMDFAIPIAVWSLFDNRIELKNSYRVNNSEYPSRFVCALTGFASATGTVIKARTEPVFVGRESVKQLVLTAGHALGTQLGKKGDIKYRVSFDEDPLLGFRAFVLQDFSNWNQTALIDPLTDFPYALPHDLGLLAVAGCDLDQIADIPIAESISVDEPVYIVGYPTRPNEILYTAPILRTEDLHVFEQKIEEAFQGFDIRVGSEGKIMQRAEENYAIVADYSSTSGQSGAPVYQIRNGMHELIGVNIGGATVKFQAELGKVILEILKSSWEKALSDYERILHLIENEGDFECDKMKPIPGNVKLYIENKNLNGSIRSICELINLLAAWTAHLNMLSHNLAFPCHHPLMRSIANTCRNFENLLPGTRFNSFGELWNSIKS
jgi:hypothetical protein